MGFNVIVVDIGESKLVLVKEFGVDIIIDFMK